MGRHINLVTQIALLFLILWAVLGVQVPIVIPLARGRFVLPLVPLAALGAFFALMPSRTTSTIAFIFLLLSSIAFGVLGAMVSLAGVFSLDASRQQRDAVGHRGSFLLLIAVVSLVASISSLLERRRRYITKPIDKEVQ